MDLEAIYDALCVEGRRLQKIVDVDGDRTAQGAKAMQLLAGLREARAAINQALFRAARVA